MNSKTLLVNIITLLFRESQIEGMDERSSALVREVLQSISLPDLSMGFNHDRELIEGLKATAIYMAEAPVGHKYEVNEILQRLKMNTLDDEDTYKAFVMGIEPEVSTESLKRITLNIKRTLNTFFKEQKLGKILTDSFSEWKFRRNTITNTRKFVAELATKLEPYMVDLVTKDPAVITDVDMNNLDQVTSVFNEVRKTSTGVGILKTGWQGINRMFNGGFRRGELVVIGALQSKFKTGFSLTLFKQLALYNIPVMIDNTKKPLLLRISFEDSATLNFQFLYQSLKENETGQKADLAGISDEDMARYVQEKLGVAGYNIRIMHVNPSLWGYKDICNKIIELESEGYEIHMCMADYLIKVPTTGCDQGPMGSDVFNMYERIGNFFRARGITFITPHQLSTDAKMMIREGRGDFVKELPGRGFYMKSKQIDQVVDLEVFIHIEVLNGKSYLTVQKGRHRGVQTPIKDQYIVLPFTVESGILDDINGKDTSCVKVGGGAVGSGEEIPFWSNDQLEV